jgi:tape measure domain-containing protein
MAGVDNRVVEMTFKNDEFERRSGATLKSLEALDQSISGIGKTNGLANISEEAGKVNLSPLSSAIEGVSGRFIALSAIAITTLANITNRVVDASLAFSKSFAVEPVTQGFGEYELKMGAIQTMMASTGEPLSRVNEQLANLNAYSDKTIYSFADMTQNIGKFTNAGVGLDESVGAIKGVANAAALSGATAEEAARAMRNFGQAMGQGYVGNADWNSIESANMATKEFKQQLIDSAVAAGTLTEKNGEYVTSTGTIVSSMGNFGLTLMDQWLTADALTTTLNRYADETTDVGARATKAAGDVKTFSQMMGSLKEAVGSGWSESFENIFGNFDQAKELFTGLSGVIGGFIGEQSKNRNILLGGWNYVGGRADVIEGLKNIFTSLGKVLGTVRDAFRSVFPPMTIEKLAAMSKAFKNFTENLKVGEVALEAIRKIFVGVFTVIKTGITIVTFVLGLIKDVIVELTGLGTGVALSSLGKLGDVMAKLNPEKLLATLEKARGGIVAGAGKIRDAIQGLVDRIKEIFDKIPDFEIGFGGITKGFDKVSEKLKGFMDIFGKDDSSGDDPVTKRLSKVSKAFVDTTNELDTQEEKTGGIVQMYLDTFDKIGKNIPGIADIMTKPGVVAAFASFTAGIGGVWLIADKLGNLFGDNNVFAAATGTFNSASQTLSGVTDTLKTMQTSIKSEILLNIAIALAVLTASVIALTFLDPKELAVSLGVLAVGLGQLLAAFKVIDTMDIGPKTSVKFIALGVGLLFLAGAVLALGVAARLMASMDWEELAKGLGSTLLLLAGLATAVRIMSSDTKTMVTGAAGLLAMSFSILLLSVAVKAMAGMDAVELAKGLTSIAIGLGTITVAMNLMPSNMAARTAGIFTVSLAMIVLSVAIKMLGSEDLGTLAKGVTALVLSLMGIGTAMRMFPRNLKGIAINLIGVGIAFVILAYSFSKLAELSWSDIAKGLTTITTSLSIIAIAIKALNGSLKGGIGLILLVFGLKNLAGVIQTFAGISWGTLLSGLFKLALTIGILAGGAFLIAPALGPLAALGVALVMIGVGIAAFGLGAMLAAKAFVLIAEAGTEAADVVVAVIAKLGAALPGLGRDLAKGLVSFAVTLISELPKVLELLWNLVRMAAEKIWEGIKFIVGWALDDISGKLTMAWELIGKAAEIGWDLLKKAIGLAWDGILWLIDWQIEQIKSFLSNAWDKIKEVADTAWELFKTTISGAFDTVVIWSSELPGRVFSALGDLASFLKEKGRALITGLYTGATEVWIKVIEWVIGLGGKAVSAFGDAAKILFDVGKKIMNGLWDGLKDVWEDVKGWFHKITGIMPFEKGPPARDAILLYKNGTLIMGGLLDGLKSGYTGVEQFLRATTDDIGAAKFGDAAARSLKNSLNDLASGIEADMSPTIRPVLDLTEIRSGANDIASLLGGSSYSQALSVASAQNPFATEAAAATPSEIKFEQTIVSPTNVSLADIFRQTRNQLAFAREELSVI